MGLKDGSCKAASSTFFTSVFSHILMFPTSLQRLKRDSRGFSQPCFRSHQPRVEKVPRSAP